MDLLDMSVEIPRTIIFSMAELTLIFHGLELLTIIVAMSELADLIEPLGVFRECLRMVGCRLAELQK